VFGYVDFITPVLLLDASLLRTANYQKHAFSPVKLVFTCTLSRFLVRLTLGEWYLVLWWGWHIIWLVSVEKKSDFLGWRHVFVPSRKSWRTYFHVTKRFSPVVWLLGDLAVLKLRPVLGGFNWLPLLHYTVTFGLVELHLGYWVAVVMSVEMKWKKKY